MRVLYVGPTYYGSNGTCWRDAFVKLGHSVRSVDSESLLRGSDRYINRMRERILRGPAEAHRERLNKAVLTASRDFKPDLVFYVQARYIRDDTVQESSSNGTSFVYMNDDMFNTRNQTPTFLGSIRVFDCVLTTKKHNVPEFMGAGARLVHYQPNAYDPAIHYPVDANANELPSLAGDAAFVGTFRQDRADFLADLIERGPQLSFNIWGGGWQIANRLDYLHRYYAWKKLRARIRGGALWGPQMSKVFRANKICLGLLNALNRDQHTSRTMEIPAAGGFMLAERSEEHQDLFAEDKEAVYFTGQEELVSKLQFYSAADSARIRIALGGYMRCVNSAYRYEDRAAEAIAIHQRLLSFSA